MDRKQVLDIVRRFVFGRLYKKKIAVDHSAWTLVMLASSLVRFLGQQGRMVSAFPGTLTRCAVCNGPGSCLCLWRLWFRFRALSLSSMSTTPLVPRVVIMKLVEIALSLLFFSRASNFTPQLPSSSLVRWLADWAAL
jgi:hypothetical protein